MNCEELILKQLDSLFWLIEEDQSIINENMQESLERVHYCFSFNKNKYYDISRGV